MRVKCLYALLNLETGDLVPAHLYRHNKYAWCYKGRVYEEFKLLIEQYPTKYQVVTLMPVALAGDEND